ncbi:hypothetical protein ACH5RR_015719 [Cinchona calisaya]|uniref:Uncharacterized protein n=1 Tax=Cinchona calisaya TaxID=153742 RepID=A0ABD2ZXD1_9GENT
MDQSHHLLHPPHLLFYLLPPRLRPVGQMPMFNTCFHWLTHHVRWLHIIYPMNKNVELLVNSMQALTIINLELPDSSLSVRLTEDVFRIICKRWYPQVLLIILLILELSFLRG